jgi:hypothetical protein
MPLNMQFTADSVITLHDPATGEPVLAVIVEPQGRDDADKQYSWPAYVTNVRRAAKLPLTASASSRLSLRQRPPLPARSWRT